MYTSLRQVDIVNNVGKAVEEAYSPVSPVVQQESDQQATVRHQQENSPTGTVCAEITVLLTNVLAVSIIIDS